MKINWAAVRDNVMWGALLLGFLLVLWAGFGSSYDDRKYVFDTGFRLLRMGSYFAVFSELGW